MLTFRRSRPGQARQPLRVLLIDSDTVARRRVADYLRSAGLEVQEASDALGALVRLRLATPDVLVVDPAVPSSRALLGTCRHDARLRAVPLLLLSRQANLSQAIRDLRARAGLAKATDLDVLMAVLMRIAGDISAEHNARTSRLRRAGYSGYPPAWRLRRAWNTRLGVGARRPWSARAGTRAAAPHACPKNQTQAQAHATPALVPR